MGKRRNPNRELWKIPDEDMPHVGDIWSLTVPYGDECKSFHFLLVEAPSGDDATVGWFPDDGLTFEMLKLETGETRLIHMNMDLDEWLRVA
jgi:hypothetical protein